MEQEERTGRTPPALASRPDLSPWAKPYWDAWTYLRSSRPLGFGAVGWIPVSEISSYLDIIGETDVFERLRTVRMVSSLDAVYVDRMNQKDSKDQGGRKAPRKARRSKT